VRIYLSLNICRITSVLPQNCNLVYVCHQELHGRLQKFIKRIKVVCNEEKGKSGRLPILGTYVSDLGVSLDFLCRRIFL
jgi:hypothetical protein